MGILSVHCCIFTFCVAQMTNLCIDVCDSFFYALLKVIELNSALLLLSNNTILLLQVHS